MKKNLGNIGLCAKQSSMGVIMKKKVENKRHHATISNTLPKDVLIEVVAKMASNSVIDLFNASFSCKEIFEAAQDKLVFQQVNIGRFHKVRMFHRDKFDSFVRRCIENENPEELYLAGIHDYFADAQLKLGLNNIESAANKGHLEACYVYGVILLSYGGKLKEKGSQLLCSIKDSKLMTFKECRDNLKQLISTKWFVKHAIRYEDSCGCPARRFETVQQYLRRKRRGWYEVEEDDDYYATSCENCRWDAEVIRFTELLEQN